MPGEWRPYFLVGRASISASSTGTIQWTTGSTEEVVVNKIRIHATSNSFDITSITNQGGIPFTNATSSTPLDGNLLTAATKNSYYEIDLPTEWQLPPDTTINFAITDTSGSTNEIFIVGIGKRRTV